MKNYSIFSFFFLVCLIDMQGQISFTNSTSKLQNEIHHSGVAIGVLDMNNDGTDDIVRLDQGYILNVELQNSDQTFTNKSLGSISNQSQWAITIGDVDNDGMNEVVCGGFTNIDLIKLDLQNETLDKTPLPDPTGIFAQGTNFADINNDGFLDIFSCHDNAASVIWENDGESNFTYNADWIDFSINGSLGESASGNYGSTWVDVDNDGDLDLYIAKCRQGVTDPTDERRINKLYINDGAGNYSEQGEARGLAVGWQSWTADFADINNDGYFDCFITNHDYQTQMFLNDGTGHFSELLNSGVEVGGTPIQGMMRDFDNDGWNDVIVSGIEGQIFKNNGDLTFTEISTVFDENAMESFALGDLNNDGYVDVYAGYAHIFTTPSAVSDKVWMNAGGDNKYVAFILKGEISNRNAIGARVELYGEWGVQIREVRAGESYGIHNSGTQYFGIGNATSVDSAIIYWPSGIVQIEKNISPNSKLVILEGGCLAESPVLDVIGETTFCPGDSVVIMAAEEYSNYTWSNGSTENSIVVKQSGVYSLIIQDDEGCTGFSESVNVLVDPELNPEIDYSGPTSFCEGKSILLSVSGLPNGTVIEWSNGDNASEISAAESGTYFVTAEGLCSDFVSDFVEIFVQPSPDLPETDEVVEVEQGYDTVLYASGENIAWYEDEVSETPIVEGDFLSLENVVVDTSFFVASRSGDGQKANVGMEEHAGTFYSTNGNGNSTIVFDALEPFTIDSLTVYTDTDFTRSIVVMDQNSVELARSDVFIDVGKTTVYVGLEVPKGNNLSITTDPLTNLMQTGSFGPRLRRSSENVDYPYLVDDVVTLKSSNFGDDWYYYFYDWKISTGLLCESERTEVEVKVVGGTNTQNKLLKATEVFPIPASTKITVKLPIEFKEEIQANLFDIIGNRIYTISQKENSFTINLDRVQPGIYTLCLNTSKGNFYKKIVVTK